MYVGERNLTLIPLSIYRISDTMGTKDVKIRSLVSYVGGACTRGIQHPPPKTRVEITKQREWWAKQSVCLSVCLSVKPVACISEYLTY